MEIEHTLAGKLLLLIGAVTAASGVTLADADLFLSLCLKFVSFTSFFCYLLINQDQIEKGWNKFIKRFKK